MTNECREAVTSVQNDRIRSIRQAEMTARIEAGIPCTCAEPSWYGPYRSEHDEACELHVPWESVVFMSGVR